jgi:hypothetical protein
MNESRVFPADLPGMRKNTKTSPAPQRKRMAFDDCGAGVTSSRIICLCDQTHP